MRGAVGPRVLAVAAACAAALVALGGIATLAVWGFREGPDRSVTGIAGWLLLVWLTVLLALVLVVVVALVGARSLRSPLLSLSRAAKRLRVERLPAALRAIEAGGEPAPAAPLESDAPSELREVAGAVDDLERLVYHHAKRARRAERDIGGFLAGAADRLKARARIAERVAVEPAGSLASGLRRDAGALGAFVPAADAAAAPEGEPAPEGGAAPEPASEVSISDAVAAAAGSTLRPSAVAVGTLEVATVDPAASAAVVLVLGEMIDAALASGTDVVVSGSVQPEGYHFVVEGAAGERAAELASIAEALRARDAILLPFGLRAAAQVGRRARLLVWLTTLGADVQWHVLVPPDSVTVAAVARPAPPKQPELDVLDLRIPAAAAANGSDAHADLARLAAARRLCLALTNLLGRLEIAVERRAPDGPGLDEAERIALIVDGTRLAGKLQQAQLCSPSALRSLLRAIDEAVDETAPAERTVPLAGSARDRATLPYEALAEVRAWIVETAGASTPASS